MAGACHKEPKTSARVRTVADVTPSPSRSCPRGRSSFSPVPLGPRLALFPGNRCFPAEFLSYVFPLPLPRAEPLSAGAGVR